MPRICCGAPVGQVFHILNRGNGRDLVFHGEDDFAAFVDLLQRAKERTGVRVYAYCLMLNRFHAIVERKMNKGACPLNVGVAFRWDKSVGLHHGKISGLYRAARALAVYAS